MIGEAQGGHLIAKIFNGSGDIDNLVAMDRYINKLIADYDSSLEQWLSAAVGGYTLHVIGIEAGAHISVNQTMVKFVGYQNQL